MLFITLFIFFVPTLTLTQNYNITDCQRFIGFSPHCLCDESQKMNGYKIICPSLANPNIVINFIPTVLLKVQCSKLNRSYDNFQFFRFDNVRVIKFKFCPLPEESFHDFSHYTNFSYVQVFIFNSFSKLRTILRSYLFDGMEQISDVRLQHNKISILDPLRLPNLISLYLTNNELLLQDNVFMHCKKLMALEMGSNKLENLPTEIFKPLKGLKMLNLQNNNIKSIHAELFVNQENLQSLDLHSNKLENLSSPIFYNMTNLKQLDLSQNKIAFLSHDLFVNNRKLELLKLCFNRELKQIDAKQFCNQEALKELYISYCSIETLDAEILQPLYNLNNLSLAFNKLIRVDNKLFRKLENLSLLDLTGNNIKCLDNDAFTNLSNLIALKLQRNKITNLTSSIFRTLRKLNYLDLSNNNIIFIAQDTFIYNVELRFISLERNNLYFSHTDNSPFGVCHKLEHLNLAYNKIQTIFDDWKLLLNLKYLNLHGNNYTSLTATDLNFLCDQLDIYLTENKIKTVYMQIIEEIEWNVQEKKKIRIYIDKNPLVCDCELLSFINFIKTTTKNFPLQFITNNMMCEIFNGAKKQLNLVNFNDLLCVVQKNCPKPCSCQSRAVDKTISVNCSFQNLKILPSFLPYNTSFFNVQNNFIRDVENISKPKYMNLSYLDLSSNNISEISVVQWPPHLKIINLMNNSLHTLAPNVLNSFEYLINTSSTKFFLSGNKWKCNCHTLSLYSFLRTNFVSVKDLSNVTCYEDNISLIDKQLDIFCQKHETTVLLILGSVFSFIIIVVCICFIIYYKYKQTIKVWLFANKIFSCLVHEHEVDSDKKYDAFISYSHKDEEFVLNELVPELENGEPKYSLCLHFRDWLAGEWIPAQIAYSVQNSKRTIIVLSKNFATSIWGHMEFQIAHKEAMQDHLNRIIIIVYGELPPQDIFDSELKLYLKMNTYLKWNDPLFWERLKYALPHPPPQK